MLLKSFTITDFQSVRNSTCIDVGDVTCIVGKNEAGKSALLKALYRLNPVNCGDDTFDVTDDYPRSRVTEYEQGLKAREYEGAIVTTAVFTIEPHELRPIEAQFGKGVIPSESVSLTRGYENKTAFALEVDEQSAAQVWSGPNLASHIYHTYLAPYVPIFLYFDEYYQMRGCENIEALQQRIASGTLIPSDHPLIGLIALAGLELDELVNPTRTQELKNKLQGAGNHLSKQMLKYWSQNKHLRLAFDVRPASPGDPVGMRSGTNIWAEVVDQKHFVNTPLGTRSRGFVAFFSFLAWYSRLKTAEQRRVILLLDEPGLSLHAKAQEDLLRFFEQELKGHHQLLYSTHSPFMVDASHLDRVRIVQDESIESNETLSPELEGTKVVDVLDAAPESLFPLQGALAYDLYRSLFTGANCLVVQGVPDLLFLQTLSAMLGIKGRTELSSAWTITPVGGADKISTFVALTGANNALRVAILTDAGRYGGQKAERPSLQQLLSQRNVLTFGQFTGKVEADIEDMFEPEFYVELVNREYAKQLSQPFKSSDLNTKQPRILAAIEEHLGTHPLKSGTFNRYRPARNFAEKSGTLALQLSAATLDRFEEAFRTLNALLGPAVGRAATANVASKLEVAKPLAFVSATDQ